MRATEYLSTTRTAIRVEIAFWAMLVQANVFFTAGRMMTGWVTMIIVAVLFVVRHMAEQSLRRSERGG